VATVNQKKQEMLAIQEAGRGRRNRGLMRVD
jgi:hypothetical protein